MCRPQRVTKPVWGGVGLSNLNKTFIFIKTVRRLPKKAWWERTGLVMTGWEWHVYSGGVYINTRRYTRLGYFWPCSELREINICCDILLRVVRGQIPLLSLRGPEIDCFTFETIKCHFRKNLNVKLYMTFARSYFLRLWSKWWSSYCLTIRRGKGWRERRRRSGSWRTQVTGLEGQFPNNNNPGGVWSVQGGCTPCTGWLYRASSLLTVSCVEPQSYCC